MLCRKSTCPKGRRSVSSIARQAVINQPNVSVEIPPHIKRRREELKKKAAERAAKEAEKEARRAAKKALYDKYVKRPKFFYGPNNFKEGVIVTLDQSSPQEVMDAYAVKDRINDIIMKDRYKIEGDYFMFASTMDYPVLRIALDALPNPGKKQKEILDKKRSLLRVAEEKSRKRKKEKKEDNPDDQCGPTVGRQGISTSNQSQKIGRAASSSSRSSHDENQKIQRPTSVPSPVSEASTRKLTEKQISSGTVDNLIHSTTQPVRYPPVRYPPIRYPPVRYSPAWYPPVWCPPVWYPPPPTTAQCLANPNLIVIDRKTPVEVIYQYAPKSRINGIIGTDWCKIEGDYIIARKSKRYPVSVRIKMDALDLDLIRKLVSTLPSTGVPDLLAKLLEEKESEEAKRKADSRARRAEVDLNERIDPLDLDTSPYKENVDPSRKRNMHEEPAENNPSKKAKTSANPF